MARPKRPPTVFVCTKCIKKAEDGRAIRRALKRGVSDHADTGSGKAGRLVGTKCMGLCPKRAVTLASGATLVRGELLMVKDPADVPQALAHLLA